MSCGGRYLSEKIFFTKALYAEHSPSGSEGFDVYIPDERKGRGEFTFSVPQKVFKPVLYRNIHSEFRGTPVPGDRVISRCRPISVAIEPVASFSYE